MYCDWNSVTVTLALALSPPGPDVSSAKGPYSLLNLAMSVLPRHATDTLAGIWFWLASTRCSLLPNRPWLTSSRRQGGRHLSDVAPAMYVSTHRPPRRACRPPSACASCSSTARKLGFECVLHPRDGDAGSGDRRRYVLGERRQPASSSPLRSRGRAGRDQDCSVFTASG